jgi:predicted kinase
MPLPNHINPDHFLDLENATAVSREQGAAAWDRAYEQLATRLAGDGKNGTVFLVFGLQGSGKSAWIGENAPFYPTSATFFDGALPSRKHRQRALGICKAAGCPVVAVWINTPFELALERNARRSGLARIREETIAHVRDHLESPSLDEGFSEVIEVEPQKSMALEALQVKT